MGINFPNSPLVGDLWPSPAVAGQGQYTWDGEKWASGSVPASRASIYAAPFDAMAYSGMQINGSMEVSQELGTAGRSTGGYVCDGWRLYVTGTMAVTAAKSSAIASGFPASLGLIVSTAQASLGSSDVVQFYQIIEGYRVARLGWGGANAQPITLGFWSAHHRTGVYGGVVSNAAGNRCYAFNYTQVAADIPQYNTITILGDTTGAWVADNNSAMNIVFAVAAGATNVAPSANTWLAGSYSTGPGQVNGVAATSDVFRITGVVVLPGIEAPSAARSPLIMRPYDQELVTCRRYWQTTYTGLDLQASAAGIVLTNAHNLSPVMRSAPAINIVTTDNIANVGAPTYGNITNKSFLSQVTSQSAARTYWFATLSADARL